MRWTTHTFATIMMIIKRKSMPQNFIPADTCEEYRQYHTEGWCDDLETSFRDIPSCRQHNQFWAECVRPYNYNSGSCKQTFHHGEGL